MKAVDVLPRLHPKSCRPGGKRAAFLRLRPAKRSVAPPRRGPRKISNKAKPSNLIAHQEGGGLDAFGALAGGSSRTHTGGASRGQSTPFLLWIGHMTDCCTPARSDLTDRIRLVGQALRLEWLTVGWMVVEAVVAIASGVAAGSLVLLAFGLDSVIELASAGALIWRLSVELRHGGEFSEGAERI